MNFSLRGLLRGDTYNFWSRRQSAFHLGKYDSDVRKSDEVRAVVGKFSSLFIDGALKVVSVNDEEQEFEDLTARVSEVMSKDIRYSGQKKLLEKICEEALLSGGFLLRNIKVGGNIEKMTLLELCQVTAMTSGKSIFDVDNYIELFRNIEYCDAYSGQNVRLSDMDELALFKDNIKEQYSKSSVGTDGEGLGLRSRFTKIESKISQSIGANKMMNALMKRCAFIFLSKRDTSEFSTISTSTDTQQKNKDFTEDYAASNSSVVVLDDNVDSVDVSIDVKKTGVFDCYEDVIGRCCNMLGVTRAVLDITGSTYANSQTAIIDAIQNGVQGFANILAEWLTGVFREGGIIGEDQKLYFDYSRTLAVNSAKTTSDVVEAVDEGEAGGQSINNDENEV